MDDDRLVVFAERLSQLAAAGADLQALAAHLSEVIGCAVLLEDSRRQPIAVAGGATPPSGRAVVEDGDSGQTLKVLAGTTHVGWLSAFPSADNGDGRSLDLIMRLAAAAIGREMARTANARSGGRRDAFWERLLGRTYHDAGAARDDAASSGIALAPAYLAVALEPDGGGGEDGRLARTELRALAADVFRRGDADLGLLERGPALLVFVPAARELEASNARTAATLLPKSATKRKPGFRLCGGVGTVETPLALYAGADAAEAALAIGRRVFGPGRVVVYEDLGAYPLLFEGADVRRLQTFARRVLEPLRTYDRKHQTELERTLRLFFAVGQNVKTAAAQLDVHRHTVFYRLRQIGEICGQSLENPHDQLTLRMAVAIDALHSS